MKELLGGLWKRGGVWIDVRFGIEPRDVWIGLYWMKDGPILRWYLCFIPCVVLRLSWWSVE